MDERDTRNPIKLKQLRVLLFNINLLRRKVILYGLGGQKIIHQFKINLFISVFVCYNNTIRFCIYSPMNSNDIVWAQEGFAKIYKFEIT